MNAEQEIRAKLGDFAADQDLMRDVYMTDSQRAAYERILARALEQREGNATTPAKAPEGARVMPGQRAALGDMGEGTRLSIYRQEDGDLIVSVIEPGMRFNPVSVEFCTPGGGGGKNSALYWALSAVHAAMPAFDIAAAQPSDNKEADRG